MQLVSSFLFECGRARVSRGADLLVMFVVVAHRAHPHEPHEAGGGPSEVPFAWPWRGVCGRVVHRHIELQRLVVDSLISLDEVEILGMRMTELIEPGPVVDADGVDD